MSELSAESNFIFIEASTFQQSKSKRPSHLEARLKDRNHDHLSSEKLVILRRQKILNERKRKLSDRNKKARDIADEYYKSKSNQLQQSIENNMKIVAGKRSEILKNQKAQCASKVARAKKIASEMRAREEMLSEKRKKMLEHRITESNLRRMTISRIPRSQILNEKLVKSELMRMEIASRKIQSWWKKKFHKLLREEFMNLNLANDAYVKGLSFENLGLYIKNSTLIKQMGRILAHAKRSSRIGRQNRYKNPTKIFLSAYILVQYPRETLGNDCEQSLLNKAKETLSLFKDWIMHNSNLEYFAEKWREYHLEFQQWKKRDIEKILKELETQFQELEDLKQTVMSQVDYELVWKPKINDQQEKIRNRAIKIGGQSFSPEKFVCKGDKAIVEYNIEKDSVAKSFSPSSPDVNAKRAVENLNELTKSFGLQMSNVELVHEMALNDEFQLRPSEEARMQRTETIKKQVDFMTRSSKSGNFGPIIEVFTSIRTKLLNMVKTNGPSWNNIASHLDIDLLKQQLNAGTFDESAPIEYIVSTMSELCAPVRDEEIKKLKELSTREETGTKIKMILEYLEIMQLDLINYHVELIIPVIKEHAINYESSTFSAALAKESLQNTEKWLQQSAIKLKNIADKRNPEKIDIPENKVLYASIYYDALVGLIFAREPHQMENFPETLRLDFYRIRNFQNQVQLIACLASLDLLVKNMVPKLRDDKAALSSLASSMKILLTDPDSNLDNIRLELLNFIKNYLGNNSLPNLSDEKEKILGNMIVKTISHKDKFFRLMFRRIENVIKTYLKTRKFQPETKIPVPHLEQQLHELVFSIDKLSAHNRKVHSEIYDNIINSSCAVN